MIEAAGSWELGWSAPLTEADRWWAVLESFGVDKINMFPVSGIKQKWLQEYPDLLSIMEDKSHLTPVFVDERGACELSSFKHPVDALYIFGKANWSPPVTFHVTNLSVNIATPKMGMLWPDQALATVLYHRSQHDHDIRCR